MIDLIDRNELIEEIRRRKNKLESMKMVAFVLGQTKILG